MPQLLFIEEGVGGDLEVVVASGAERLEIALDRERLDDQEPGGVIDDGVGEQLDEVPDQRCHLDPAPAVSPCSLHLGLRCSPLVSVGCDAMVTSIPSHLRYH